MGLLTELLDEPLQCASKMLSLIISTAANLLLTWGGGVGGRITEEKQGMVHRNSTNLLQV